MALAVGAYLLVTLIGDGHDRGLLQARLFSGQMAVGCKRMLTMHGIIGFRASLMFVRRNYTRNTE
jgi:hypothetical protein